MEHANEKDLVVVGRLMKPHGFKGEIKCAPETHDLSRCNRFTTVLARTANGTVSLEVQEARVAHDLWLLRFKGYDSPESLRPLVNADLCVPMCERIPAPEGKYYFSDLEGFSVIGDDLSEIGKVLSVEELPSVNAFRFAYKGSEILAPWIDACVLNIDTEHRSVRISEAFLQKLFAMRVS